MAGAASSSRKRPPPSKAKAAKKDEAEGPAAASGKRAEEDPTPPAAAAAAPAAAPDEKKLKLRVKGKDDAAASAAVPAAATTVAAAAEDCNAKEPESGSAKKDDDDGDAKKSSPPSTPKKKDGGDRTKSGGDGDNDNNATTTPASKKIKKSVSMDPALLDSPVKNIRVLVRMSSKEILGVEVDPILGGEGGKEKEKDDNRDDGEKSNNKADAGKKEDGKELASDKKVVGANNNDNDKPNPDEEKDAQAKVNDEMMEEEIDDVMAIALPSAPGKKEKEVASSSVADSGSKKGEDTSTSNGALKKKKDTASPTSAAASTQDGTKITTIDKADDAKTVDNAVVKAAKAALLDYDSDVEGDDEEDPGDKDDSSYAESNKGGNRSNDDEESLTAEVVVEVEGDAAGDDDDHDKNTDATAKAVVPESHRPDRPDYSKLMIRAKVRITGGQYKGRVGTIIDCKRGWCTLNKESGVLGKVRKMDFRVLQNGDGRSAGSEAVAEGAANPAAGADGDMSTDDDDDEEADLTGATVRIKSGKFEGLTGKVNERRSYRHVQIDAHPPIPPIDISNVNIVRHAPGEKARTKKRKKKKKMSNDDLAKMYMGAEVRVTRPDEFAGVKGKVLKVIIGDWYITDNPKITNAYQAHKFEVLSRDLCGGKEKKDEEDDRTDVAAKKEGDENEGVSEVKEEEATQSKNTPDKVVSDAATATVKLEESKNSNESTEQDEKMEDGSGDGSVKVAAPAAAASATASSSSNASTSNRRPSRSANNDLANEERNLIGATIRIKKGRYKNLMGMVKEKHSMRRLQLDTIPNPLGFDDIQVLEYAGGAAFDSESNDDFAKKYQQYVGAKVKVISGNEDFVGTEGMVIRVIVMGDWYITDNPNIPMAFPEHKFEVVRYPEDDNGVEEDEDVGDDDDVPEATIVDEEPDNNTGKSEEGKSDKDGGQGSTKKNADEEDVIMKETNDEGEEAADNGSEFSPEPPTDMDVDKKEDAAAKNARYVNESSLNDVDTTPSVENKKDDAAIGKKKEHAKDKDEGQKDSAGGDKCQEGDIIDSKDEDPVGEKQSTPIAEANQNRTTTNDANKGEENADSEASAVVETDKKKAPPPSPLYRVDPLVGATVFVYSGNYKGHMGKIIAAEQRGWWIIDNPSITSKVKSGQCQIVDDGDADIGAIWQWYSGKERKRSRMPTIIRPKKKKFQKGKKRRTADDFDVVGGYADSPSRTPRKPKEESAAIRITMGDIDEDKSGAKRKISETDFTGDAAAKRRKYLGVVVVNGREGTTTDSGIHRWGTNPALAADGRDKRKHVRPQHPKMRECTTPALNPILLQPSDGIDQLKMQLLPATLRHLPPDTKIEIFNRRTGRIMKGDNAIALSELPRALMDHAEYEPIVPPPPGNTSITRRVGRSGPKVRINIDVVPQTRIRASRVEGRSVLVTGGEYRGLTGKIDSTIPGGWYLVSSLFKHDTVDIVINSQNLELIPEKTAIPKSSSVEGTGIFKLRMHLRSAKLRLEAFAEERVKVESGQRFAGRALELMKMDVEVGKTNKLIEKLQSALDRRLNQPAVQKMPLV